ncbi:hypothetical protein Tco_1259672, partial [Tanacetum coccineum]
CPDCPKVSGLRMLKTYDRESLSAHELHITAGIKSLINAASITAAHIRVNAARLFNVAEEVNAASEEVSTAELDQQIIYEDKYKRNRLMSTDGFYMFSDETLTFVRSVLHDIASNLRMDYLPKRRWSSLDRKRSRIMIKAIDQLLLERRLMRSLEKFVGGRDYGEDL